jgi:hypothetical protein
MTEKQSGIDKEEYRQMVLLRMVSHIEYIFLCDVHCQEILIYHLQWLFTIELTFRPLNLPLGHE